MLTEQERLYKLHELIEKLSELEGLKDTEQIFESLEDIYGNTDNSKEFRHYYSEIFSTLLEIRKKKGDGSLAVITNNLRYIQESYVSKNHDVSKCIKKLADHIYLEVAQIEYVDGKATGNDIFNINLKAVKEELKSINAELDKAKNDAKATEEKMANIQKEYVAILGIFSSIVVTLVAGISLSGSSLNALSGANAFEIALFIALIAGFCYWGLKMLLWFIFKMVRPKDEIKWLWNDSSVCAVFFAIVLIIGVLSVFHKFLKF